MSQNDPSGSDFFGAKPAAEALKIAVESARDGCATLFNSICRPATDEIGLLVRDHVKYFRLLQLAKIAEKTQRRLKAIPGAEGLIAHPRVVGQIIENSSWEESDKVQDLWSGLLTSSCTEDGKDDSNLMFVNLLSQLNRTQALTFAYACEHIEKRWVGPTSIVAESELLVSVDKLQEITGIEDLIRLDRELDHMRALGILRVDSGFLSALPDWQTAKANLGPSDLGLQMYIRCQGSRQSAADYFGVGPNDSAASRSSNQNFEG